MLKKEQCVPGALLKIRPQPKTGLPAAWTGGSDQNKPYVMMTAAAGSYFDGHRAIYPGAVVTVVRGPKRTRDGGNTLIVRDGEGVEGHVFWCEMRASADLMEKADD